MADYKYSLDNSQPMTIAIKTGGAVTSGKLLAISSGLAVEATSAASTVLGICTKTVASGGTTTVLLLNSNSVIRVPFSGTTKTSLADADKFGTKFDITSAQVMNLDDTTGGFLEVVNYKNTASGAGYADVVISAGALWNK